MNVIAESLHSEPNKNVHDTHLFDEIVVGHLKSDDVLGIKDGLISFNWNSRQVITNNFFYPKAKI